MHPSALFLIVVAAAIHGHLAASTPAARFWQQALQGTPMPEAIADLVQKGSDQSPIVEHYPAFPCISVCEAWNNICTTRMATGSGIFFDEVQLRPGSTMSLSFPAEAEPPILPHDVAEKVPFANLSAVQAAFGIPAGAAEAAHVAATLSLCQSPPHAGELKACAAYLETTVRSATDMLGGATDDHGLWAAMSLLPAGGGLPRGVYDVREVTQLDGDHYVACHKVPFPYRVYQCHMTAGLSDKAFVVSLRSVDGGGPDADMVAFCHLDTAKWNPAHPAFEVLRTRPGTPVCHVMPYTNFF